MRALVGLSLLCLFAVVPAGCTERPTEEDCKKAIANLQKVYKYDAAASRDEETMAFVRKCRARSSKKSVTCLINATTEAEIDACNKGD